MPDKRLDLYCVPQSIANAWTYAALEHAPVRIAVYHVRPGVDHSQAEVKVDGKWVPLTLSWDNGPIVQKWKSHYPDLKPYRYLTLKDWIDEQIQYTLPEEKIDRDEK
jgi:hypothetical protein